MANITLDELRAKYPPQDREEYDRAYATAILAGQLAELVYTLRTRAGLTQTELARRMGTSPRSPASKAAAACPLSTCSPASLTPPAAPCASLPPASATLTSAEPPDQGAPPGGKRTKPMPLPGLPLRRATEHDLSQPPRPWASQPTTPAADTK
jgi:hypothetical protein